MRNTISRIFRCFIVPPNIVKIHAMPSLRALNFGSCHTVYAYLTGLLLALIEIKYEGCSSKLFKEHVVIVMLFLISKFVYVISLPSLPSNQTNINNHQSLDLKVLVCHISGTIACELLVLLLVSPIEWFIINASSFVLSVSMILCNQYLLQRSNNVHSTTETGSVETPASAP